MTIIRLLSSSQGFKGNDANIELARQISLTKDKNQVKELVDNLGNTDKNIQSDCIKVLYELGYLSPEMISDYYREFFNLLKSKNNRLVWGGMIALSTITNLKHKEIFKELDLLSKTIENGSVITIDCGVEILAKLNKHQEYIDKSEPILIQQLWKCPIKQLPQYMEKSVISITMHNKEIYKCIIEKRKPECDKDSQVKRLDIILKKIKKVAV